MSEVCYHCGLDCKDEVVDFDQKKFCCNGCKSVYEILNTDKLKNFYELNPSPGIKPSRIESYEFEFLDQAEVQANLLLFQEKDTAIVRFKIPVIHCSSCVWVLENLQDIQKGIRHSQVHFTQKTIQINYNPQQISLRELAEFLAQLGYKPAIRLEEEQDSTFAEDGDKKLLIKLGIAGFCFGNVMLFAFPEYFTQFSDVWFEKYKIFFRYLMLLLSLPVVFYCAHSYFQSAFTGIKNGLMNIDIPISIGIAVLFLRSIYEVLFDISSGYFDSLCGLVFFMLIGKYFQQNTYKSLSFDRNYKSFYPLTISKILPKGTEHIVLSQLKIGDRIRVRNGEMIPADAIVMKGKALLDNSFITGESDAISKKVGDKIFAGGKQCGEAIELEIIKEVDQSYLTSLWQNVGKEQSQYYFSTLIEKVSRYFTWIVLAIALIGGVAWYNTDQSKMFQVVTAVLIVACPCALALATPFTLGNIMRILGRKKIYTKDITTIEKIAQIQSIVLDKTGTLTETLNADVQYVGEELSPKDRKILAHAFSNSTHPLSRKLSQIYTTTTESMPFQEFQEIEGKGIQFVFENDFYKLGSKQFLGLQEIKPETVVCMAKNDVFVGKFVFQHRFRKGLSEVIQRMKNIQFSVLSGDTKNEKRALEEHLKGSFPMYFNQSPDEKMKYIQQLQSQGQWVMMIGDGLNDAAALQQSNVGVAITDDVNTFTPASDVIMKGSALQNLPSVFQLSQKGVQLVKWSMLISFLYNLIGLSFALAGMLSPLVAAILMPISSISVVLFASVSTWYFGRKYFQ